MKPGPEVSLKFTVCFLFLTSLCYAQNVKDSSLVFPMVKISYSMQVPGGDLAKRFGYNSNVGGNFSVKTKRGLVYGANGSFLFGDQIKEIGILDSLKTSSGFIINQNGYPEVVRLFERGFILSLHIGKIFPMMAKNKNSGLIIYGGPSFLRHKIKIDDIGRQAPQLSDSYRKGYDRLTTGFGLHEFIGYVYLGNKRILNFFAGFEFTQAFTKSRRSYNFDEMKADTQQRTDLLHGIRIGWILPLYKKNPQQFYYY